MRGTPHGAQMHRPCSASTVPDRAQTLDVSWSERAFRAPNR